MSRMREVEGVIDRRLLINFRVDPDVAARVVPAPFEVTIVNGAAVAGICLIRLTELRPRGLPRAVGIVSEGAAHRFAVEWDGGHGVYIPRRDTSSRLSVALGGRAFPGEHHFARFTVHETDDHYDVAMRSADGHAVEVRAHEVRTLPAGSVFAGIDDASDFFRRDPVGYSRTRVAGTFDGIEMDADRWHIDPLVAEHVHSSFFEDRSVFAAGSVAFDSALSMRRTQTRWHARAPLVALDRPRTSAQMRG